MSIKTEDLSVDDVREVRSVIRMELFTSLAGMAVALTLIFGMGIFAHIPVVQTALGLVAIMLAGGHATRNEYTAYMTMVLCLPLLALGVLELQQPSFESESLLPHLAKFIIWILPFAVLIALILRSLQLWSIALRRYRYYAHLGSMIA